MSILKNHVEYNRFCRKKIRFVSLCNCLLFITTLFSAGLLQAKEFSDVSVLAGYRQDSLDWNINGAGNPAGSTPNILSELTWRDLKIFQLRTEISAANAKGLYFRGSAGYGWVLDGENQDSDYAGNNRTLEFSRSINGVDGSRVMDFKGGIGYVIPVGSGSKHVFVPLVGYSYHTQQLNMKNGTQVLSNLANAQVFDPAIIGLPAPGPFPGLNSSYDAAWSGAWVGADLLLDLEEKGTAYMHLERHWPNYSAKANWNLRDEFAHPVSFEHDANGRGWVLEMGWQSHSFDFEWVWGASINLQQWTTGSGTDRTYLVIPGPPCFGNCYTEGIFNEVNWSSRSINITLSRAIRP